MEGCKTHWPAAALLKAMSCDFRNDLFDMFVIERRI